MPTFPLRAAVLLAAAILLAGGVPALADELPPGVHTEATDSNGIVFADHGGRTLYTWAADKPGASKCNDERIQKIVGIAEIHYFVPDAKTRLTCRQTWPPFAATAADRPTGNWSIITREDQIRQWAYLGKPLYTFIGDSAPGEVNATGPGRTGLGRRPLLAPQALPAGVVVKATVQGRVLFTRTGRILYTRKADRPLRIGCRGDCDAGPDPLLAPALVSDQAPGEWSVVSGAAGARQWAFRGRPLYMGRPHAEDMTEMAAAGWTPVSLQAPLKPPAEFRLVTSSMGPILADAAGKTLYLFGCVDEAPDRGICDIPQSAGRSYWGAICGSAATCAATWKPVVAPPGARPVGRTWSLVAVDATGAQQFAAPGQPNAVLAWAYKGRPVYTYAGDKAPGDANGHRVSASYYWGFGALGDGTDSLNQDFDVD